jgi:dUTP pyrophosphatase
MTIPVKYSKINSLAKEPTYATDGSGCFDLYNTGASDVYDDYRLHPGEAHIFHTGLVFQIPKDHVMLVFSRSGHGFNSDVSLSNSVGVIDSDFTGEVKVKLRNDGDCKFNVSTGDRIAQAMILPYPKVSFEEVPSETLTKTARGDGGFGSTGK